jgi:2,3-bisphosphoglycerate-independent phosphoglycerate mutase
LYAALLKAGKSDNTARVVLLFLDGVGIGRKDPETNPFFRARLPALSLLCGGVVPHKPLTPLSTKKAEILSVNATLGMPGLPQSGTGQTAIFTGINGAKMFGRHFGPHPPSILRPIIAEKNIFRRLQAMGKSMAFANAFPQRFFEFTESATRRLTVTTLACRLSGVPLRTIEELRRGEAISPDFIRARWSELGHPEVDPITASEAGKHLAQISVQYDFTLFEYWLTDHAGHSQKMAFAVDVLERFDEFLSGFLRSVDLDSTTVMIISDHGNIEDLSTRSHTRNRVLCIIAGEHRGRLVRPLRNLTDVTPTILRLFQDL